MPTTDPMTGKAVPDPPEVHGTQGALMALAEFSLMLAEEEKAASCIAVSAEQRRYEQIYALTGEVVSNLAIDSESMVDAQDEAKAAYSRSSLLPDIAEIGSQAERLDQIYAIAVAALTYITENASDFEAADE